MTTDLPFENWNEMLGSERLTLEIFLHAPLDESMNACLSSTPSRDYH